MTLRNCDCGTCCEPCGHYPGCIRGTGTPDPQPAPEREQQLAQLANGWDSVEFTCGRCGGKFEAATQAEYLDQLNQHWSACPVPVRSLLP